MKKLLMIILMLGVSGSVWAEEVKLLCVSGDRKKIITFDKEAGLVNGNKVGKRYKLSDEFISSNEGAGGGEPYEINEVNRLDGSYYWQQSWDGNSVKEGSGTCSLAKQKFQPHKTNSS